MGKSNRKFVRLTDSDADDVKAADLAPFGIKVAVMPEKHDDEFEYQAVRNGKAITADLPQVEMFWWACGFLEAARASVSLTARQKQILAQALHVYDIEGQWNNEVHIGGRVFEYTEEHESHADELIKLLGFANSSEEVDPRIFDDKLDADTVKAA